MERIPPSARVEAQIDELLSGGLSEDGEHLAELGRLGARLVLQRAVEEEVTAFLGRARYERTVAATGSRNGTRPKPIQTAEGEITIAMPQVRNTAEQFVSRVIPDTKAVVRTRPLEALIIGSYVRGLSDRDIESLTVEAGLGQVSKTTVSRICRELRDRYRAFCSKSLAEVSLLVLFLDAVYLPTRPRCLISPVCMRTSRVRTGRSSTRRAILPTLSRGCASSSRTWSGSTPAPRPAWPMICQRCVSTSSTCPVCASGCDRRICWNVHWRRCAAGPKSLVGSRVRPVV